MGVIYDTKGGHVMVTIRNPIDNLMGGMNFDIVSQAPSSEDVPILKTFTVARTSSGTEFSLGDVEEDDKFLQRTSHFHNNRKLSSSQSSSEKERLTVPFTMSSFLQVRSKATPIDPKLMSFFQEQ